ncbi:MAG: transcriptional regulator [Myxococcota bacterium]
MSTLVTRPAGVDFNELLNGLGLSKGNLVIHLRKLEEAGYVRVRRGFVGRMRRTVYTATKRGRRDFSSYLELLEEIIRDVRSREEGP